MDNRKFLPIIIIIVIAAVVIIALSSSIFYTIDAGERAVIFYKFGGGLDKENVLTPGFGMKAPWNDLYVYEVREKSIEEKMDVLDKNGLSINVDVTLRFHPIYDQIGYLHENFGVGYVNTLVIPEVRSAVRQVMGRFSAEEIYSTKRGEVEAMIKTETEKSLNENNCEMRALLIRSINLPEQIRLAIENKLKQEQEALAYQFRLDKEKSEAERKRIAAEGEAVANKIINNSLTPELLKMRGIEATLELAKSPNSKVVVVGSGKDGMPLILGNN
ncbi:prohibitin family protein [Fulvivirga kasyanovii]|uniref:Prohibitin family protein n=1 Tax=Fulvivirga kasyanovii TaxID=396812 RepID=A0ABW9RR87_9BACT|nr:prohibitin family protein [Fulvivirga kasyanovii]MTI25470.1 prohibitin family protein [Fulvivirga kasyanovii]